MPDISPVKEEFGAEKGLTAIVMAPAMDAWDKGEFCTPLTELLVKRGYRVTLYDTMSLVGFMPNLADAAACWKEVLLQRHSRIDLAIGQAYGGALLQHILGDLLTARSCFIGLSAPTFYDDMLRVGLDDVLLKLREKGPEVAIQAKAWWVLADNSIAKPPRPKNVTSASAERVATAFNHLRSHDARDAVARFTGRALWLHGERSRLVRDTNLIQISNHPRYRVVGLANCGMRPLTDARVEAICCIESFLNEAES